MHWAHTRTRTSPRALDTWRGGVGGRGDGHVCMACAIISLLLHTAGTHLGFELIVIHCFGHTLHALHPLVDGELCTVRSERGGVVGSVRTTAGARRHASVQGRD